jgi:regulator of sigma E protease
MFNILTSFFAFIVAIVVLVVFHEYGHFWMARKMGVKVLRFSVGLGKPLYSRVSKSGTEFVLAAIPLGGYIKMLDGNEGDVSEEDKPYAFNEQSVYKRFAIVLAGPLFNFIFAVLAYWLIFLVGIEHRIPIIGKVTESSIAQQADLKEGNEIIAVSGVPTSNWSSIVREMVPYIGESSSLEITTKSPDGDVREHQLNLDGWEMKPRKDTLFESLGFEVLKIPLDPVIEEVLDSEPAQISGFKAADKIIEVNGEPIDNWNQFVEIIHKNPLTEMLVVVERGSKDVELLVTPRVRSYINDPDKGYIGVTALIPKDHGREYLRVERWGPVTSLKMSIEKTWGYIKMTYVVLGKMVVGDIGIDNISGPITIAKGAGSSASGGWLYFVGFLAIISISLGVLNLLPIPILDGGHLMYYCIEMITRKPVSIKVQIAGYKLGLFLIIFLMTVALYNDIIRMF